MEPKRVDENDCLICGASWFLPFLAKLKSSEPVSPEETEEAHERLFGKPVLEMKNQAEMVQHFGLHAKAGGQPWSFFTACRVVEWDKNQNAWQVVFST